jgi:hypothetical protein
MPLISSFRRPGGLTAATAVLLLGATASISNAQMPTPDLSGIWSITRYEAALKPADKSAIPLSPQGKSLYAANQQALKAKSPNADTATSLCVPHGVPRSLTTPYPYRLYQSGAQITFIHEANRAFRLVAVTDKHADQTTWDPSFMGDGIARWEQDTLVIETTNFNDKTWLDDTGLPHSDQLRVTERLRLVSKGEQLEDTITIEDPGVFTRAWTTKLSFKRRNNVHIVTDSICGQPRRDVSDIPGAKAFR